MLSQYALLLLAAVIPKALCTAIPSEDTSIPANIPRDFVDRVMASFTTDEAGQLVSRAELHKRTLASRGLEKRAVPIDNKCPQGVEWVARYCKSDVNPRAWHDRCTPRNGGTSYWAEGGECPEKTQCFDQLDADNDNIIVCQPDDSPNQDNTSGGRQYGYRLISPVATPGNTQHLESIKLLLNIPGGSSSGHLSSTDDSFVVAPLNTLTANLKGHQLNLCRSNTNQKFEGSYQNSRSCNPLTSHDFVTGESIDYTFGLSPSQSALLFYSIVPASYED